MAARIEASNDLVEEVNPTDALILQRDGAVILDVRDDHERAVGMPLDAQALPLASIESGIDAIVPSLDHQVLTICASGQRSLRAAGILQHRGFSNVASIAGGFRRWQSEGLPVVEGVLDADATERYSRHLLLPNVGISGQTKVMEAKVALIGAGGLGSPAALYLAAAGVGTITLIDDDAVDKSNLQRQIVHSDDRVGMAKTESARMALNALNPRVTIAAEQQRVQASNVESLLVAHDVVIDGADNFPTRYLLDAATRRLKIPLVYGAVHRFTGQVSVFDARREDSPCYRCLFPQPPSAAEAPNCAEAGVLGVLPGTIGLLQATEAIKLILGIGEPLIGRLLCYDALAATFRELRLSRDPKCPGCGADAQFSRYEDLVQQCAAS
jgi:molybdopterin/thiamine biosynthesis adenylyltransferase/rhodanese-related sulfurtransferase